MMKTVILHVGMPRTGTTSIQSTLFWSGHAAGFRLLTLDTDFGNQLVLGAFDSNLYSRESYFASTIPTHKRTRLSEDSRRYLTHCLEKCRNEDTTPVLSAEAAYSLSPETFKSFREFCEERGFRVRILCYLRSPHDLLESSFTQDVKVGSAKLPATGKWDYAAAIKRMDSVFGEDQVSVYVFDPHSFPDRCVVTHFCQAIGWPVDKRTIIRQNDSLNLNVIKFLYTSNRLDKSDSWRISFRLLRRAQLDAMSSLPGPSLRFHRQLAEVHVDVFKRDFDWLERRLGRSLPLTLVDRTVDEGIRSLDELGEYSPQSLEWLEHRTCGARLKIADKEGLARQVARSIRRVGIFGTPRLVLKVSGERLKIHRQRSRMMQWMKLS
jgi:hypothetical protein